MGQYEKGAVGGISVIGNQIAVERVKSLNEFFKVDILILLAFLFSFLFFISNIFSKLLPKFMFNNLFEYNIGSWLILLFTVSGLSQIVLPIIKFPFLMSRISAIFYFNCTPLSSNMFNFF